jgi:CRP/FNR family transcriptional regulator, anaerobic regulatory protein
MEEFLKQHIELSGQEYCDFIVCSKKRIFGKGQIFSEPENIFDRMFFIIEGFCRSYRLVEGDDITYAFYGKDEFCVDFYSYLTGKESDFFYEALTETSVYEFTKNDFEKFYQTIPQMNKLGRLMAEKAYQSVAERLRENQIDDLETRYLNLLKRNPALFQSIQQKHIATFLGVKPESLSRIKSQIYRRRRIS